MFNHILLVCLYTYIVQMFNQILLVCLLLNIETGRHPNIDSELRHCYYCLKSTTYSVEDEFHMLVLCPLYPNVRREFFLR